MIADSDDGALMLELVLAGVAAEATLAEQALARRASAEVTADAAVVRAPRPRRR